MEELERKEKDRREKKLMKQLEKQQKKLAAKGIHVDMDSLKKDYDHQKAGGKSELQFDAQKMDEEIDVVGLDRSDDQIQTDLLDGTSASKTEFEMEAAVQLLNNRKKVTAFSIESLLRNRVEEERQKKMLEEEAEGRSPSPCPSSPRSFRPARSSSPGNDNENNNTSWHKPQDGEEKDSEDESKEGVAKIIKPHPLFPLSPSSSPPTDLEHKLPPPILKPSPTFPPALLGLAPPTCSDSGPAPSPFSAPNLNFLAAAQQLSQGLLKSSPLLPTPTTVAAAAAMAAAKLPQLSPQPPASPPQREESNQSS